MKNIAEIDKNFKLNDDINEPDIKLYDVKNGQFGLHGLFVEGDAFRRMPEKVAKSANEGVEELHLHTAGGRLRFVTDSEYIVLSCKVQSVVRFPHMTATGVRGFDLYVDNIFKGVYRPPIDMQDGFSGIVHFNSREKREITINFPLYNDVKNLYLGLQEDACIEKAKDYAIQKPVLFYGSSITQGGCASRPGNCYTSILSRMLDFDYINLGFSGSARGEQVMAEYIAGLPMSAFVMDYDHNATDVEHLEKTHEPFFKTVRQKNPDLPIIIITKPDLKFRFEEIEINKERRAVIYKTYENAKAAGDEKVWFIDGETLFGEQGWDSCTVDGCHPNDMGFWRMAETVRPVLAEALK